MTTTTKAEPAVRERPILFSGEMVKAILDGRKTQTRRIINFRDPYQKDQPREYGFAKPQFQIPDHFVWFTMDARRRLCLRCPYGKPGDRLWVRETTERYYLPNILTGEPTNALCGRYVADQAPVLTSGEFNLAWWYSKKTCPPIHMPRWASRITLELTAVRIERLIDITEADAQAEGASDTFSREKCPGFIDDMRYTATFSTLWDSIHGDGAWATNPFVWVLSFKPLTTQGDPH